MRDRDVRKALFEQELERFESDGQSRIVEELCLCQGDARVDVAVINGELHGYEIKSKNDTLDRLASQVEVYSKVLDRISLVVEESHLEKSLGIIPEWWGVISVWEHNEVIKIHWLRPPFVNPNPDPISLSQLLWRDEVLSLLALHGIDGNYKNKSRRYLWERLATSLPFNELNAGVRSSLKNRKEWRVDSPQTQGGGLRRPLPRSSGSRSQRIHRHSL